MDLSRPFNISVDYQDKRSSPNWELRIFAEVVLIDKTYDASQPQVYQLKDSMTLFNDDSLDWNTAIHRLPRDAFVCLGQAVTIDKQKKQINLVTKNTVSYNYLIIVSGSKPNHTQNEEKFSAGVQTLADALRVKRKIPLSLTTYLTKRYGPVKSMTRNVRGARLSSMCSINKSVPPHLAPMTAKKLGINLNLLSKRLYEVLL
jgi:NADH dehydrogenase FAD-containing subunit